MKSCTQCFLLADSIDHLLASVSETIDRPPGTRYQFENFRHWFDCRTPLYRRKPTSLRHLQDMVGLHGSGQGWLFHRIEKANSRFFTDKASGCLVLSYYRRSWELKTKTMLSLFIQDEYLSLHPKIENRLLAYAFAKKTLLGNTYRRRAFRSNLPLQSYSGSSLHWQNTRKAIHRVCSNCFVALVVSVATNARSLEVLAATALPDFPVVLHSARLRTRAYTYC